MRADDRYIDIVERKCAILPTVIGMVAMGIGGGLLLAMIWHMNGVLVGTL